MSLQNGLLRSSVLWRSGAFPTLSSVLKAKPVPRFNSFSSSLVRTRFYSSPAASVNITPPRRSRIQRFVSFCAIGIFFTSAGIYMAAQPSLRPFLAMMNIPTDVESLTTFKPKDEQSQKIDDHLVNHPVALALRANPDFREQRPHMKIPEPVRNHTLVAGSLLGPGKIWVPPIAFLEKGGKSLTAIMYLGQDICGHPGIIHGGLLATVFDESLARCCFGALPNKVGMTASLTVNYRKPLPADTYVALRAVTTKVEGRKAWVEGRIETLVKEGETPVVYADATALFVEPRQAKMMARYAAAAG